MSRFRLDYKKAITHQGNGIKAPYDVTYKIDGCRVLHNKGRFVSRDNISFPGFEKAADDSAKEKLIRYGDCEVFVNCFKDTISILAKDNPPSNIITDTHIYPLSYGKDNSLYDHRLHYFSGTKDLPQSQLDIFLQQAVADGYEGLVVRTPFYWYRIKPSYSADVIVTGYIEQVDKKKVPKGILGGLKTKYGVITGFTETDRIKFWQIRDELIGRMIQVEYKERYHTGKFRYACKFVRFRDDKKEESFDK